MSDSTLRNGLRVLTVPLGDTSAATVFVFARVGSRHETRSINGVSHFIEHLMFKGTVKRPTTAQIARELDGVGAQYNAFTSKDWTGYYVKINAERLELAVDVLSDMLLRSRFDPREIDRERGTIIEEINMYEDNPLMSIDDLFETAVFGDHHPLGWSIAGPRQVIRRVQRSSMLRYRGRYYHARNMVVVVAGKLGPHPTRLIERYFRAAPQKRSTPAARSYLAGRAGHPVRLKFRDSEQVQIGLGAAALRYTDRRLPTLNVLSNILGGSMSSRLFIQVRERRGLCYSIHTSVSPYEDTGAFMIQAGLDKQRLAEALTVIMAELKKIKTTPVAAAELARAKENIRGRMILNLEDSDAVASWYGRQALFYPRIETPEQALKKVAAVTAADLTALARRLFQPRRMRLAVIGPFRDERPYARILRQV